MAVPLPSHSSLAFSSSSTLESYPQAMAAALPLSGTRRSRPQFGGLRIQLPSNYKLSYVSMSSRNARVPRPSGGGLVCEAIETAVDVPVVTDETWQSLVLKADGPVLVEVSAPWCGPCRIIHPVVVELSEEYAGKLKFYKLNTDQSPSTASKYGIRSVPTIMMFVNGEKKDAVIGAVPKTTLTSIIEKFL